MPIVTTLHTILRRPNSEQRRVMQELITRPTRLVVMAERGRQILQDIFQASPAKIDRIPRGIRDALHVDRVNQNQGAKSTLAFLLALAETHLTQNFVTVFNQPVSWSKQRPSPEKNDTVQPPFSQP